MMYNSVLRHSSRRRAMSAYHHLQQQRQQRIPTATQLSHWRDRGSAVPWRLFSAVSDPVVQRQQYEEEDVAAELQQHLETTTLQEHQQLQLQGLKSRPIPNGNWDVSNPLAWAQHFGRRSLQEEERLRPLVQLQPGDEGYFFHDENDQPVENVTIVRTKEQAHVVLERLYALDPTTVLHACDTEVMEVDLKTVGPVGNGYVTCLSMYSGPDFDYGLGQPPDSVLWIDNLDDAYGVSQEFKDWFQDPNYFKVWHNYGFDRRVMWNEGILVQVFGGDTMHMARLQDTSRSRADAGNGYSLEALTTELLSHEAIDSDAVKKITMKELFGVPRMRKDGSLGSILDVPPIQVLQRDPTHRNNFIDYSCKDAKGTWQIRQVLQEKLQQMDWTQGYNLYDYYQMHMRPFGEVLTDMERRGIRVDAKEYLAQVEIQAREDRAHHCQVFRQWAAAQPEMEKADGLALNPASSVQMQTFLFGGSSNIKTNERTESKRVFKVPREEIQSSRGC